MARASDSEIVRGKLTRGDVRELSRPHKTVRDAIHGDVLLNHLEVAVMDTPIFQRLRGHKQLGLTDRIYSSAEHSRFQHAIGTLFVAILMLANVNRNADLYHKPRPFRVDDYGVLVTRLAALIHDIVNIPFGHTIEDEGLLIPKDWKDAKRVEAVFNDRKEGSLFQAIVNAIAEAEYRIKTGLDDEEDNVDEDGLVEPTIDQIPAPSALAVEKAEMILNDVRAILTFDENSKNFEFAYAADIVGNTFCADLLDYLERDAHFTGTQGKFRTDRSRAISYLFIPEEIPKKRRLVIRLWHHHRFRDDVLSEIFNVLRARKDLAEGVYFHHTKVCLSAMLTAAVQRSGLIHKMERGDFLRLSDQELLDKLESSDDPVVRSLALDVKQRRLYRPVYRVSRLESVKEQAGIKFKDIMKNELRSEDGARARAEYENKLAQKCGLKPGEVIIHCPDTNMNLKAAKAQVLWEEDNKEGIVTLDEAGNDVKSRIMALDEEHKNLWKFHVFVHRRVGADQRRILAAACKDLFGRDNEIRTYRSDRKALELSVEIWRRRMNVLPHEEKWMLDLLHNRLPPEQATTTRTGAGSELTTLIDRIQEGKVLPSVQDLERIRLLRRAVLA